MDVAWLLEPIRKFYGRTPTKTKGDLNQMVRKAKHKKLQKPEKSKKERLKRECVKPLSANEARKLIGLYEEHKRLRTLKRSKIPENRKRYKHELKKLQPKPKNKNQKTK